MSQIICSPTLTVLILNLDSNLFDYQHLKIAVIIVVDKKIQSTLIISNSKGLAEALGDIRTLTYQS